MTFSITFSFIGGRYHATPWGRHANEGVAEWPPAPWRILRALAAVWQRTMADDIAQNEMEAVLAKLATPPVFKLPRATLSHTRHYQPWYKTGPTDKTLVFDNFVALAENARVGVMWPEANLTEQEQQVATRLLANLHYFGRAESWCDARVCDDWATLPGAECGWTGKLGPRADLKNTEPVRTLCAEVDTPDKAWNKWGYGDKALKPHPEWNLLAENLDLHKEGWSDPPGSRWLTYYRPRDAFATRPIYRKPNDETVWFGPWGITPETPAVARFAMDGPVLPLLQDTVYVGELIRKYAQSRYGKKFQGASSPLFSGKSADGEKREGHEHAFYLPLDDDEDGRLESFLVVAPKGLTLEELKTLSSLRTLYGPSGMELNTVLLEVCALDKATIARRSRLWRSITPFVATRHYKERGAKRDNFPYERLTERVLLEELQRRNLPEPIDIRPIAARELSRAGRSLPWREFRQQRVFGDGRRGSDFGKGFEIEFAEPVSGPIALGYACHFGLGLFVPA